MIKPDGKVLSVAEMARIIGASESFIKLCVNTGYLQPGKHAAEKILPVGGQEVEARKAIAESIPFVPKMKTQVAEETFIQFWKSPKGKKRLTNARTINEMQNKKLGRPVGYIDRAGDLAADKFLSNLMSKMRPDSELEILDFETVMEAKESA